MPAEKPPPPEPILVIAGTGALAKALRQACRDADLTFYEYSDGMMAPPGEERKLMVAVHVGSGRQYASLARWCGVNRIPMLQGSTMQSCSPLDPPPCAIIEAPNLALPIILSYDVLAAFKLTLNRFNPTYTIIESHQKKKTTLAGTALLFAKILGIGKEAIASVRNPGLQLALGVPAKDLDRHAHHIILIDVGGMTMKFETQVQGLGPYAQGAIHLARNLLGRELSPDYHEVKQFI
jgi:4-hydroxy-tetrahydrodipicolinate reductase